MSSSFCGAELWRTKDASLTSALAAELVPELAAEFANIGSVQPIRQASTAIHRETPVATTARKLRNGQRITKAYTSRLASTIFCFGWSRNVVGRAKIASGSYGLAAPAKKSGSFTVILYFAFSLARSASFSALVAPWLKWALYRIWFWSSIQRAQISGGMLGSPA